MGVDVWLARHSSNRLSGQSQTDTAKIVEVTAENSALGTVSDQNLSGENTTDQAWQILQQEVVDCERCGLCATRTQTVFGSGNQKAQWLLIGEAPGQNEDQQGVPFVGKAGQLLTEMLRAMGLSREEVYITNILKCRPPNNRDPNTVEVEACKGHLQRQIELIKPEIILAVGRVAAQKLLNTDVALAKLRGTVHNLKGRPLMVIYHPAYLLRSLTEKRKAWADMQMAMKVYRELKK